MSKNKSIYCSIACMLIILVFSSMIFPVAGQIVQKNGPETWQPPENFIDPVTLKIQEFRAQGLSDDEIIVALEKLNMGWYPETGATWIGKVVPSEEVTKLPNRISTDELSTNSSIQRDAALAMVDRIGNMKTSGSSWRGVSTAFCALLCLLPFFFSSPAVGQTSNSFPSTFHVTFQGHMTSSDPNPDGTAPALWVQLLNGTDCHPKTVSFTFSMEESPEGEYTVKFMLTFDNFSKEVSLPAMVSNGRVFIDSTSTIFVVDPASLVDGNTIQLFQTENRTLSGTVLEDGRPSTLINDYRVASKVVRATYAQTNSSSLISLGSTMLFFDPKTGVLTQVPTKFSDVLLNKLGVEFIVGGIFELSGYSENLNFALVTLTSDVPEASGLWVSIPVFVIVFVLVMFLAYRSLKKKKREKRTTSKHLKFQFASEISR